MIKKLDLPLLISSEEDGLYDTCLRKVEDKINEIIDVLNQQGECKHEYGYPLPRDKGNFTVKAECMKCHSNPPEQGECPHLNTKVVKITEKKYNIVCECGEITGVLRRIK